MGDGPLPTPDVVASGRDVDVIVIDRRQFDGVEGPAGPIARAREASFEAGLTTQGFQVVSDTQDIVVLRR